MSITSLTSSMMNEQLLEDCEILLKNCSESLLDLNQKAFNFIEKHEEYKKKNYKDAKILKEEMKKVVRQVFSDD